MKRLAEAPAAPGARARRRSVTARDTDPVLVEAARSGDAAAFAILHERYLSAVTNVIRAETRRGADVADLVQETFTSAWTRLHGLRDPDRFRSWLLQIARHAVIDHARAAARRPVLDGDDELSLSMTSLDEAGPAELAELSELAEEIHAALDGLSRRDVVAITLAAQFGFGPTEVAEALDLTPNNAKVVLHRARRRLLAQLGRAV